MGRRVEALQCSHLFQAQGPDRCWELPLPGPEATAGWAQTRADEGLPPLWSGDGGAFCLSTPPANQGCWALSEKNAEGSRPALSSTLGPGPA